MASSKSGGVLANDGEKMERSGSKFRNSLQSEVRICGVGCSRSSCGISNRTEKSSVCPERSGRGSAKPEIRIASEPHKRINSPGGEVAHEGKEGSWKKSRSNEDNSSGSTDAGLGIWKDWSKPNQVGVVDTSSGSDTACGRPHFTPLGRLGWEQSLSLSDKRLFLGRSVAVLHSCRGTHFCRYDGGD